MKKTILITGTSSGIGKAAVFIFAQNGWNVVAAQRTPEKETSFSGLPNVLLVQMDVTDQDSIVKGFKKGIEAFGRLDIVVNNAGFGVDGVFEAMTDEIIEKQFNTNVFGLMRVTREAIRHMRTVGGGTIIQISSMGGKMTFPLYSIYHSTKFAVEGFTESLHYELAPFDIRLKLIEPGLTATEFTGRSRVFVKPEEDTAYNDYLTKFSVAAEKAMKGAEKPEVIAREIYRAATDGRETLRYPVGAPSPMLIRLRKLLSDKFFFKMVKATYKL
jgi:NAD(P)-dependent dehydrogenase (short-subunit alcohol dehydrogenase family)